MRVLQINAISDSGSTGRTCREMNDAFREKGHTMAVAFSVGLVEDRRREYKIGDSFGQQVHALLSRLTGLQGYFSSYSTKKLLSFINAFQPELVILRNLHANYIHLPMLLKYLAKKDIPTVAVLHDCWFYTGKCCHYTVDGCYRWQEECGNCPAKKKYNVSWIFDRSGKMHRDKKRLFQAIPRLGVVAVSEWTLKEAKKAPVFKNAVAIKRIYNWIDTELFAPADGTALKEKLGITDRQVILCIANIWDQNKGVETVIKIANQLRDTEQMVVVGELSAEYKLPPNVIRIPRTDDIGRLVELYSMADVFLQPSLQETFGKVSTEALSCGTPIVCFDSTANAEQVGENCGTAVPVGDLEALLLAMRQILDKGKAYYTDSCRDFAVNHFGMDIVFPQYMQFFEEMQKEAKGEA